MLNCDNIVIHGGFVVVWLLAIASSCRFGTTLDYIITNIILYKSSTCTILHAHRRASQIHSMKNTIQILLSVSKTVYWYEFIPIVYKALVCRGCTDLIEHGSNHGEDADGCLRTQIKLHAVTSQTRFLPEHKRPHRVKVKLQQNQDTCTWYVVKHRHHLRWSEQLYICTFRTVFNCR